MLLRGLTALLTGVLVASSSVRADESWPGTRQSCRNGRCVTVPTTEAALQALADLRARAFRNAQEMTLEDYAAISAAAAVGGATVYGVGRYSAYRTATREAARAAPSLRSETVRVGRAVALALEPELQRLGSALLTAQRNRAAQGAAALTAAEMEQALVTGMKSPEVRGRIMTALTRHLGGETAATFEKIVGNRSAILIRQTMGETMKRVAAGLGSIAERTIGRDIAQVLAKSVAPSTARLTLATAARAAAARSGGFLARCLGRAAPFGRVALGVLGSGAATAAFILLDPSPLGDGTRDGHIAAHPDELLRMDGPEATQLVESSGKVARAVIQTRDVLNQMDQDAGATPVVGDMGEMLSCPAERHESDSGRVTYVVDCPPHQQTPGQDAGTPPSQ